MSYVERGFNLDLLCLDIHTHNHILSGTSINHCVSAEIRTDPFPPSCRGSLLLRWSGALSIIHITYAPLQCSVWCPPSFPPKENLYQNSQFLLLCSLFDSVYLFLLLIDLILIHLEKVCFSIFVRSLIDRCIAQPLTLTLNIKIKCWTLTPKHEPGPLTLKPNLDPHTAIGGCEHRQKALKTRKCL